MTKDIDPFNVGYRDPETYDDMLPPHFYAGKEDIRLVADWIEDHFDGRRIPRALDIGCGNGRSTEVFASRVDTLVGADKSDGMIAAFAQRFPDARAVACDTENLPALLRSQSEAPFDLVTAFWSLSYPILECFEELDATGVHVVSDESAGRRRVTAFLDGIIDSIADGGYFFGQFFDAESAEQRVVTELWETIAPFPGTGRGFSWDLLRQHLLTKEREGEGRFTTTRLPGAVLIDSLDKARRWFEVGHLNSYAPLVSAPSTTARINEFLEGFVRADGSVLLPSGMHMFSFEKSGISGALPRPLQ